MTIYPWQQSQWQQVLSQYQQHRLPHALLLTGPQGVGKKDFAISLAQMVLLGVTFKFGEGNTFNVFVAVQPADVVLFPNKLIV